MKDNLTPTPFPHLSVVFNAGGIPAALTDVGATFGANSVHYYWNGSQFISLAANVYHDSFDPTTKMWGFFPEATSTCTTKWSADFSNVLWLKSGGITRANATSCISGQVASKLTAAAASDNVRQIGSTSASTTQTSQILIEKGTATQSKVTVYDDTSSTILADAIIDWSTLAVTSTLGTNRSLSMTPYGVSANGGVLYKLCCTATGVTNGNIRSIQIFPDISGGGGYCYLHHACCIADTAVTMSPIVTGASNVTRAIMFFSVPIANVKPFVNAKGFSFSVSCNLPYSYTLSRIPMQLTGASATDKTSLALLPNNVWQAYSQTAIGSASALNTITKPYNSKYKVVGSFRSGENAVAMSGRLSSFGKSTAIIPVVTTLTIGCDNFGTLQFTGYIFDLNVYPNLVTEQLIKAST